MRKKFIISLLIFLFFLAIFIFQFSLLKKTFFFHDEWTFLDEIIKSPINFIFTSHNGHFWPIFASTYFLLTKFFVLNYGYYQLILLLFHFANGLLIYFIVYQLTKSKIWGYLSSSFFLLNSIYWEVIFSFSTFPAVLCLFFILLSIFFNFKFRQDNSSKKYRYLIFSGVFTLFSAYSWGGGLLFAFLFLIFPIGDFIGRKKINVPEILNYILFGLLSLTSYLLFSTSSAPRGLELVKAVKFMATGLRWQIVSFYAVSPGFLKIFLIVVIVLFTITAFILFNKKYRPKFLKNLIEQKYFLIFSIFSFLYFFVISAITRYQIDMRLSTSSRYTYLPLAFLLLTNVILLNNLIRYISPKIKIILLIYFLALLGGNIYFFNIYYKSWMETISRPNEELFWKIAKTNSREEREKVYIPSTFHDSFKGEKIYFIYRSLTK